MGKYDLELKTDITLDRATILEGVESSRVPIEGETIKINLKKGEFKEWYKEHFIHRRKRVGLKEISEEDLESACKAYNTKTYKIEEVTHNLIPRKDGFKGNFETIPLVIAKQR